MREDVVDPGEKLTRHHKIPRSRGGTDHPANIMIIPHRMHVAWHSLFQRPADKSNMTPDEAIEQVRAWATEDLMDFATSLPIRKRIAWNSVFGHGTTPLDAIEIIKKKWS